MRRVGIKSVHPVEHGGCIGELSSAGIEGALAASDAAEIEAHGGATQAVEHMKEIVDHRIVHRAAELGMGLQDHSHWGARRLLTLIPHLDAAGGPGQNNVRHLGCFLPLKACPARFSQMFPRFFARRSAPKKHSSSISYVGIPNPFASILDHDTGEFYMRHKRLLRIGNSGAATYYKAAPRT